MSVDRHSRKGWWLAAFKRGFGLLHRSAYRWSGGRLGGKVMHSPVLLLTVQGRKSGKSRTVPLVYLQHDGSFVVASSNAGHWEPAWYRNVQANPEVTVEIGRSRVAAVARVAAEDESAELWKMMEQLNPAFAEYPQSRGIAIPMVLLQPR